MTVPSRRRAAAHQAEAVSFASLSRSEYLKFCLSLVYQVVQAQQVPASEATVAGMLEDLYQHRQGCLRSPLPVRQWVIGMAHRYCAQHQAATSADDEHSEHAHRAV